MPTVTLLVKVHGDFQLEQVNKILKSKLQGLKVRAKTPGKTPRGWVLTAISGEDEKVALHYLAGEIGLCPTSLDDISRFSVVKGRIVDLHGNRAELCIDIGVSSPLVVDARIPLQSLQAQLADGRKVALGKMAELYGLCDNLPIIVKVLSVDRDKNSVDAALAEEQLSQFRSWTDSLLDRLIIIGSSMQEVEYALREAKLNRDAIGIDSLGLLEQAVTCKLGTDAAGLIPKIGRILRRAIFTVYSPKRIIEFSGHLENPAKT